jgi:hypothetical protein
MTIARFAPLILVLVLELVTFSFWRRTKEKDAIVMMIVIAILGAVWIIMSGVLHGPWS